MPSTRSVTFMLPPFPKQESSAPNDLIDSAEHCIDFKQLKMIFLISLHQVPECFLLKKINFNPFECENVAGNNRQKRLYFDRAQSRC
jgi:hypothetical protein